jgi:hypothetical protein
MSITGVVVTGEFVVIWLGAFLIVVGVVVAIVEAIGRSRAHPGSKTAKTGIAEDLNALDKILKTLKDYPLGLTLIVLGVVCLIIGAAIGGTDAFARAAESIAN